MHILSLDWDSAYQRDLANELEASGHRVEVTARASEALARNAEQPFDLVITETRLPDQSGLQFVRELRASRLEKPAVIFLTDFDDAGVRETCLKEGAARYLLKSDGWLATVADVYGVITELEPAPAAATLPRESPAGEARVFRGNLESMELLDIVQLLNLGRKTGVLVLSGGDIAGRIFFDDGEVVAAETGAERGSDAFSALLPLKSGTFRFEARPVDVGRTIRQPTSSLLLDALRLQDEAARHTYGYAPAALAEEPAREGRAVHPEDDAFDFEHREVGGSRGGDSRREAGAEAGKGPERSREPHGPASPFDHAGPRDLGIRIDPEPAAPALSRADPHRAPPPAARAALPSLSPWGLEAEAASQAPAPSFWGRARASLAPAAETESAPAGAGAAGAASPDAPERFVARAGLRGRRRIRRKSALLTAGAAVAIGAAFLAIWSSFPRRAAGPVESENYRRLVLEEADDQAKIDSLEQTIRELSISLQRGSTGGGDAARRLSVLQGEIQQAHAKREAAREAVERIQREP